MMVQQTIESKISEYGLRNPENNLPTCDKQTPVSMKKTPLRDTQNENRLVPVSTGNSPFSKEREPVMDKVSGTKRPSPECPVSPSQCQLSISNAANGPLVYVRRKNEGELGKSSSCDSSGINTNFPHPRPVGQQEEPYQQKIPIKDPKFSCFSAFSPLPVASLVNSSAKPSVSIPLGKPSMRPAPSDLSQRPAAYASPSVGSPKGVKQPHWEERYYELQMQLKKLDQSDQEEYLHMLRSFSSAELSRHAVELEKRSIQLSLEEAKEMQRVQVLNVLGKHVKNVQAPSSVI